MNLDSTTMNFHALSETKRTIAFNNTGYLQPVVYRNELKNSDKYVSNVRKHSNVSKSGNTDK